MLEICTQISEYRGYQPDITGIIKGYQEEIDQISFKYDRLQRNIKTSAGYAKKLARYEQGSESKKNLEKSKKKQSYFDRIQQPANKDIKHIKGFCSTGYHDLSPLETLHKKIL